jgi:Transcription factor WhiB
MSRAEQSNRPRGACLDLAPVVVDKYFMANANTERFQAATAKAICGRCAIQAACLLDAVKVPWPSGGIRGGETASSIQDLHRRYEAGEDLDLLVIEALRKQQPLRGRHGHDSLRAGKFSTAELLPTTDPAVVNSTVPELGRGAYNEQ